MGEVLKDKYAFVEQVKLLVKQSPSMVLLTFLTTIVVTLALWGNVENWIPLLLMGSMIMLNGARLWHYNKIKNEEITLSNVKKNATFFVVYAFIGGAIWGSLGMIPSLLPEPFLLILVTILICGLVAGSVSYLSTYKVAFIAYAVPCITPFAIRCLLSQQEIFIAIGLLMTYFLAVNLFISHIMQNSVLRSINLVQENKKLIARLKYEKDTADEARNIADYKNEAKSRFLAVASHDLRQPLHAMVFFIEAMQHEKDPDKIKSLITKVAQTSEALRNLLGSVLDISKIEAGGMKPNRSHFSLNEVLTEVIQEFTELAQQKGLDLGYSTCARTVFSDKEMLGRIIRNLVSNAIHYTDLGYVNIYCEFDSGNVTIYVTDSGIGIPESNKKDVFREFFQIADEAGDGSHGLGLGLSIVDGLGRLLGHEIYLKSEMNIGSTFSVKVPQGTLKKVVLESEELDILPGDVIAKAIILGNEGASLESISGIMRHWGHIVADFNSCTEVMVFLESEDFIPDIVISDIKLRDVSGIEAIDAIQRRIAKQIPGIILTGVGSGAITDNALSKGFSVLQKPVQPAKLRSIVSYLVQGKSS